MTRWYTTACLLGWLTLGNPGVIAVSVAAFGVLYARLVIAGLGND